MSLIRPDLVSLKPYSVDETIWQVKLDANERATGLPPRVQSGIIERLAALDFNRYPDMGMQALRSLLASEHNMAADNVLIGNGSSEILAALCQAFGGAGRSIVFPTPSFSMYAIYAKLAGSPAVPVSLAADFSLDPDKVLAAARLNAAKLVILCNPNNPTGSIMPLADIEKIVAGIDCPVVVDEAYYEFYGQSAVGLINQYSNIIIARTFSKAYGLAAARVGYMLAAADMTAAVGKVMLPYHVNALSLAAAETVYVMRGELADSITATVAERDRLAAALSVLPEMTVYPSQANFLLVKTPQARRLVAHLAANGIGIRDFSTAPGLENCLRITVGTSAENDTLLKCVAEFVGGI